MYRLISHHNYGSAHAGSAGGRSDGTVDYSSFNFAAKDNS